MAFIKLTVPVDVLGALCAGEAAFADTARALRDIAAELRYGRLLAFLPGRRIRCVVFAATKADHVPALTRDNLRHLLRDLAGDAELRQTTAGAMVSYQTVAALHATEDSTAPFDGRPVPVVMGRVMGEDKVRPFYVGTVPTKTPPPEFWRSPFFKLPRFRPPPIDPTGRNGLPHLGLDAVLEDLLGDLL